MAPEKINNIDSKENEVSDKEWKRLDNISTEELVKNANQKDIKSPKIITWKVEVSSIEKTNELSNKKEQKEIYTEEDYKQQKQEIYALIQDSIWVEWSKLIFNADSWTTWYNTQPKNQNSFKVRWDRISNGIYSQEDIKTLSLFNQDLTAYKPETIKMWIIRYNTKLAKEKLFVESGLWNKVAKNEVWINAINSLKLVDIPSFMDKFNQEQEKTLSVIKEKKVNEPIMIDPRSKDQKIGEFVMTETSKNTILLNFTKASNIIDMKVIGRADATWPRSKEIPWNQVKQSLVLLQEKWLDINRIKEVELPDGTIVNVDTFVNDTEDKNKLNQTWAYARALMQMDFLPKDQINKINNCPNFKIRIEAQDVINGLKWDKYTWWGLEMITDGNVKIIETKVWTKEASGELPNPSVNLWTISFKTILWIDKNINISLDDKGALKLTQIDRGWISAASSWFGNEDVHTTIDGKIKYNTNVIKDFSESENIWVWYSEIWGWIESTVLLSKNLSLQKDLWLNIEKDVAGPGGFHTNWIVLNAVEAKDLDKKFSEYMSNIEKTPDKFIQLLETYIYNKETSEPQKDYIRNIIKNINDAKNLANK